MSSTLDGTDFVARLDAVEKRLAGISAAETPSGLTEPDPGGTERWEAGQVWAHMTEFIGYWQREIESVVAGYDGTPVPFGRTKEDPGRLSGIELGRLEAIRQLEQRVHASVEDLKRYLAALTSSEWRAVGRHGVRGDMDVEQICGRFVVGHLEEHADQLEGLAQTSG